LRNSIFQPRSPRLKRFAAAAAAAALLTVQAVPARAQDTLDRILVVVNDEIITNSDLNQALYPLVTRLRATASGADLDAKLVEVRKNVLKDMISDRLIISAARAVDPKFKITAEEAEIDDMVAEMREKFPSEEVFDKVMKEQGMSRKKLRDRFREDIMKRKMVDFKVKSRVTLSPGEIKAFYDGNPDDFKGVPEVRARQILVRAGTTRSEELARGTVQSIVDQLAQGADFAEMAREYSEASDAASGGDMGWVQQGRFMDRIDKVIFKLDPGQTSDPIQTQLGLHLFRVDEKRQSAGITYQDAIPRIETYLYKKKVADELKSWLAELRDKAFISFQDPSIAEMAAEPPAAKPAAPVS
jgi:parvulin-like peptidyl-prolyl isomerase